MGFKALLNESIQVIVLWKCISDGHCDYFTFFLSENPSSTLLVAYKFY